MATKDDFPADDRYPVFLSAQAEETGQPDIGKVLGRATISSRILKTSILAATATAIGIAILLVGNPLALVANVTALWVETSAPQPGPDPSTPAIQSLAGTQDLPTTTTDAPARDEIAAAVEPADQSQAEISQPPNEALFKQFQAWAAEEDARAQVVPVQPVQNAPVQVRPTKKHRRIRALQNARAEIRPQRNHRAKVREEQNAREQAPPVPDARAQEQPVQNGLPWLLQGFGGRN